MKISELIARLEVMLTQGDNELTYYCDCCSQDHVFTGDIISIDKGDLNEKI